MLDKFEPKLIWRPRTEVTAMASACWKNIRQYGCLEQPGAYVLEAAQALESEIAYENEAMKNRGNRHFPDTFFALSATKPYNPVRQFLNRQ